MTELAPISPELTDEQALRERRRALKAIHLSDLFELSLSDEALKERALEMITQGAPAFADDSEREDGPLHLAAIKGRAAILRFFVDQGFAVNQANQHLDTPLHCACKWERSECALLLLEYGADPRAQSEGLYTPLHRACEAGLTQAAQALIEAGADSSARNGAGKSPWILGVGACLREKAPLAFIDQMLSWRDSVNDLCGFKRSALHDVCYKNQRSIPLARALLAAAADPNAQDITGVSPLYIALSEADWDDAAELTALLLVSGADPHLADSSRPDTLNNPGNPQAGAVARAWIEARDLSDEISALDNADSSAAAPTRSPRL